MIDKRKGRAATRIESCAFEEGDIFQEDGTLHVQTFVWTTLIRWWQLVLRKDSLANTR